MTDPAVVELINQISLRVTALEGKEYKFWLPVGISILAVIASLYTAHKAKIASAENLRQAALNSAENLKQVTLQAVKSNIDTAKAQVESTAMQLAPLKAKASLTKDQKEELTIKEQIFDSVIERLLNAYNDACQKFYKSQVPSQDFVDLYHQDIADYIREFPDKFSGPLTRFDAMLQYFHEKHKNPKA